MIAEYPHKPLADFTEADRIASRRFAQGKSHAKQGRTNLLGKCRHYDAGFVVQLNTSEEA